MASANSSKKRKFETIAEVSICEHEDALNAERERTNAEGEEDTRRISTRIELEDMGMRRVREREMRENNQAAQEPAEGVAWLPLHFNECNETREYKREEMQVAYALIEMRYGEGVVDSVKIDDEMTQEMIDNVGPEGVDGANILLRMSRHAWITKKK